MKQKKSSMKKEDLSVAAYVLGILSIVFGVLSPLAGFIIGVIGLSVANKETSAIGKLGRKYSLIGIWVSIIVFVLTIALYFYLESQGLGGVQASPFG